MLSERAELKALTLKDVIKASDGTRKVELSFLMFITTSLQNVANWTLIIFNLW